MQITSDLDGYTGWQTHVISAKPHVSHDNSSLRVKADRVKNDGSVTLVAVLLAMLQH